MDFGWSLTAFSTTNTTTSRTLLGGIAALLVVFLIAVPLHSRFHFTKKHFYSSIVLIVTGVSFLLALPFIQGWQQAGSGQKHIEAYLDIYVCDQKLPIGAASPLYNATGDTKHKVFSDGRAVFSGFVDDERDKTLGSFFRAMGGSLSNATLAIPYSSLEDLSSTNERIIETFTKSNPLGEEYLELRSGDACSTAIPSKLEVYVYRYDTSLGRYTVMHIQDSTTNYIISDTPDKPDCIIITFDEPSQTTTLTCSSHPARSELGVAL